MSRRFRELERIRVSVGDEVRDRHLAAIANELRSARTPTMRRFRLLAIAVALVLALPVLAIAAEDAVPGDALYPIKRLIEPVVALVDTDVEVDHRVREAEILLERDAEPRIIRDHVDRARVVVTDEHPEHVARLDVVVAHLREHPDRAAQTDDTDPVPAEDESAEPSRGDRVQEDRSAPSDTSVDSDEKIHNSESTTTTVPQDTTTRPRDERGDG